ncbi:MAG: mandelate racemase/muconate lactonizing enzyme family protein [Chloroflexi bacterium]|nr:mandelate racemase/muconate lactonizing enzyme family protein [Chloroflexota bacterium]
MKITKIETLRLGDIPGFSWVQIHTDTGLIGLGETPNFPHSVATFVDEVLAPVLLGENPLDIERLWQGMFKASRTSANRGVNICSISAADMALWDIYGQAVGQPLYQVLGGRFRDSIRVYNTCAGGSAEGDGGLWDDYSAQWKRPAELAESLLAEGITAMKIWPFDRYVEKTNGQFISAQDLEAGTRPFREIREAVGNKMDIALELHNHWNLPAAIQIARAVEPYSPMWFEDCITMNNIDALRELKLSTTVPVCASETLSTRWSFREVLEKHATDIVMVDIGWVGGLSEARKIGYAAETYMLPFAPHDCVGPAILMASVHLDMHLPNAVIQETVRSFMRTWYLELTDTLPIVKDGHVSAPSTPGLGMALRPEVFTRPDAKLTVSKLAGTS